MPRAYFSLSLSQHALIRLKRIVSGDLRGMDAAQHTSTFQYPFCYPNLPLGASRNNELLNFGAGSDYSQATHATHATLQAIAYFGVFFHLRNLRVL